MQDTKSNTDLWNQIMIVQYTLKLLSFINTTVFRDMKV
jgi:hypothetical protein